MPQSPLLAVNGTILWLKVILSVVTIVLLYFDSRGFAEDTSVPNEAARRSGGPLCVRCLS
jgi:hypothetical protein